MRKLKFRLRIKWKDIGCGESISFYYMTISNFLSTTLLGEVLSIDQYIGLTLKNKEIYEGDLIKFDDFYIGDSLQKGGIGEVRYEEDRFGIFQGEEYICCVWDAIYNYNGEIIGNIYENPELLREKNK